MELLIPLALAFGVMWLLTNKTRKQQKAAQAFRTTLGPGDEVMTGSGVFGTVVAVDDDVITIESAPGSQSRWLRAAIARKVEPGAPGSLLPAPVVEDGTADDDTVDDGTADGYPAAPDDASSLDPYPTTDDDRPSTDDDRR